MQDHPTRRQALAGLAALGALAVVACDPPDAIDSDTDVDLDTDSDTDTERDCSEPTSEQTEGPFYPGEPAERIDLREGRQGVRLDLDLEIIALDACTPIANAEVDVWCADAAGDYSGYPDFDTVGESWLRGQQITDAEGRVRFTAIVPGSYPGRSVHLHVKVRAPGKDELTTQVYLPDELVARVLADETYRESASMTDLDNDNFYEGDTLLTITSETDDGVSAQGTLIV